MRALTIAIFLVILGITLVITYWAAKRTKTASEFYTAGRSLSAPENGLALAGDWMSAAAFLGFTGLAALYGMDGSLYAVAALVAFLTILLLIAEPLRNTGKYTMADVIAYRMQRPEARLAAVLSTVVVNLAYMVPQMVGAGALAKLLLGIPYDVAVVIAGVSMVLYVAFGGMLATTWVQIVKAVLLLSAAVVLVVWILALFSFNPLNLFAGVQERYGPELLAPGNYLKHPLDALSLGLSFVFGTAGLPHVMVRFYTVPDAKTARRSIIWVMFLAGAFFMVATLIGFASAYFVGQEEILAADKGGNLALPLLAQFLGGGPGTFGGQVFLAFVAAVAFATILAVVAGLTLATSGAIAHDLYVNVIKHGDVSEDQQIRVARLSTFAIGAVAILFGLLAQGVNVAVLVVLAIAVAASSNFPIIALSLFWRRFNTGGVIGGVTAGLVSSVVLALLGPAFLGPEAVFPLVNPTLLSMPLGFAGAVLGTLLGGRRNSAAQARFDEVTFRAHTGVGAEV
ncbi:MAG: cation acetate symporter [Actinomycetota bacterium]|nr:cation acetate symporter [Actinomycetota bacterium]